MNKITHEQAKESLLQVYIFNDIKTNENNYVLVTEYIKQQEKQEKLLELYRKFFNTLDIELPDIQHNTFEYDELSFNYVGMIINSEELIKQIEKIKELEK